jgi:hypothetical protein
MKKFFGFQQWVCSVKALIRKPLHLNSDTSVETRVQLLVPETASVRLPLKNDINTLSYFIAVRAFMRNWKTEKPSYFNKTTPVQNVLDDSRVKALQWCTYRMIFQTYSYSSPNSVLELCNISNVDVRKMYAFGKTICFPKHRLSIPRPVVGSTYFCLQTDGNSFFNSFFADYYPVNFSGTVGATMSKYLDSYIHWESFKFKTAHCLLFIAVYCVTFHIIATC